ncbi:putative sexual development protein [Patellaria atrata CBS 101060]|uniref:Sexual development protein n=1 Tax=Patellaria atrata CBS 101060 TaxID=1346257 RepID=A0A9P4SAL8_9PEZI|nr:putative sexual development protein [Patellaria atrata CBS 101060]
MRSIISTTITGIFISSSLVSAAPLEQRSSVERFSLDNGFPTPSPEAVKQIQREALGTLSNAKPPGSVSAEGLTNLKLVCFNEIWETFYFDELIKNITNNVPGYDNVPNRDFVLETLEHVKAQEQLHALNACNGVKNFGGTPIQACAYDAPVSSFEEAISFASTFTTLVMGTLQDAIFQFAKHGDAPLTRGTASSLGQEGEQDGWYRLLQKKTPSQLPFLTTSIRDFAFSAIQQFIVGECDAVAQIPLKTFKPLRVLTTAEDRTMELKFSFPIASDATLNDIGHLSLAYINQQNVPIVEEITHATRVGDSIEFKATFPYEENLMNGLTIAAVVQGAGELANAQAVADKTLYGPGLIVVN